MTHIYIWKPIIEIKINLRSSRISSLFASTNQSNQSNLSKRNIIVLKKYKYYFTETTRP